MAGAQEAIRNFLADVRLKILYTVHPKDAADKLRIKRNLSEIYNKKHLVNGGSSGVSGEAPKSAAQIVANASK